VSRCHGLLQLQLSEAGGPRFGCRLTRACFCNGFSLQEQVVVELAEV
jgi:hypothetical protein